MRTPHRRGKCSDERIDRRKEGLDDAVPGDTKFAQTSRDLARADAPPSQRQWRGWAADDDRALDEQALAATASTAASCCSPIRSAFANLPSSRKCTLRTVAHPAVPGSTLRRHRLSPVRRFLRPRSGPIPCRSVRRRPSPRRPFDARRCRAPVRIRRAGRHG